MHQRTLLTMLALPIAALTATTVLGQDKGSVDPKPLPPLANPNDPKLGAKELFARKLLPAAMPTRVIGFYSKGCIAGAVHMPVNGETWQVMRLSRNRNWGHPDMVGLVKRLSVKAHKDAGWPGILVGDMGQPRGGPALSGHASHQIGLDADIWLTRVPDHLLACEDQAAVGTRLSLSHPHGVPARQRRMQGPAAAVGRRRLQACRTRLLVQ